MATQNSEQEEVERLMRKLSEKDRQEIVANIAKHFRCFGEGSTPNVAGNPIVEALKDQPPQFAAGVSVREVVDYVISKL